MPIGFVMAAKCDGCGSEVQFLGQQVGPVNWTLPPQWQVQTGKLILAGQPASAQLLCDACLLKVRAANADAGVKR